MDRAEGVRGLWGPGRGLLRLCLRRMQCLQVPEGGGVLLAEDALAAHSGKASAYSSALNWHATAPPPPFFFQGPINLNQPASVILTV
jgi:hypothetical protein